MALSIGVGILKTCWVRTGNGSWCRNDLMRLSSCGNALTRKDLNDDSPRHRFLVLNRYGWATWRQDPGDGNSRARDAPRLIPHRERRTWKWHWKPTTRLTTVLTLSFSPQTRPQCLARYQISSNSLRSADGKMRNVSNPPHTSIETQELILRSQLAT